MCLSRLWTDFVTAVASKTVQDADMKLCGYVAKITLKVELKDGCGQSKSARSVGGGR